MTTRYCRKCRRAVCKSDGVKICFDLQGYDVCIELKKQRYQVLECGACGAEVKIYKEEISE